MRKPLSEVRPGEQLSEDLVTADGKTVLKAGAHLSESILLRLEQLGVFELSVSAPVDAKRIRAALDRMFEPWRDDEVMRRLEELLWSHRTGGVGHDS